MRARFLTGAGLIGLIAVLSLAPAASADTMTIGAAAPSSDLLTSGSPGFVAIQSTTDPASPSFAVPSAPNGAGPWTVTSWGARGAKMSASSASLEIWRPTGTSGEFRLIAIGPEQPFPMGVLTTHSVSILVHPGDHLGIRSGPDSNFGPTYGSGLTGDVWISPHGSPVVGQTVGGPSSDFPPPVSTGADFRVNVEATLTATPAVAAPTQTTTPKKKCKKKKHKRSAVSAKKKCKKHKKK